MAYERQYTQGVGWENSPSINTPISAENLNQMDVAIQDVDEAVYDEFAAVYEAIAQAGGSSRPLSDHIVSVDSSLPILNTSNAEIGTFNFKNWEFLFLRCDVDAHYDSEWALNWSIMAGGTTYIGTIFDYRDYYLGGSDFKEDIPAGSTLVLSLVRSGTTGTVWGLYAIIPASGGGGGQIFSVTCGSARDVTVSGKVESQLVAITELPANPNNNDLLFLELPIGATYGGDASYGWILTDALQTQKSILMDASGRYTYKSDITAGDIIVLSYDPNGASGFPDSWRVRAVIPAASGGGASTLAALSDTNITQPSNGQILMYDGTSGKWFNAAGGSSYSSRIYACKVTSIAPNTGILAPNNFDFLDAASAPIAGDRIIVDVETDGTLSGGVTSWQLQYEVNSTTVTTNISDGRDGNAYDPYFDDTLTTGTTLLLKVGAGGALACIAMIAGGGGGGASALSDLSDTTITSPTAAQPLTYDATNSKWINGGIIPAANGGTGNATGYVQAGRKANTTIGTQATAEGSNTTASGSQSHAEGSTTTASGPNSHAEGSTTQATANSAHAEGSGSKATGTASHAENTSNTASGHNSHAGGNVSTSGGAYSFAHGRDISIGTNGTYAAGFGQGTVANYSHQFVTGKYNDNKSTSIFEVGKGTGTGARSNALELDGSGNLTVAGDITDGDGNSLSSLAAQLGYLEQTVTLSTSASTTVTFTDASITANSFIEYACSQWDLVPESITGAAGSCTIVLPKVDSAQSVTVRIYVR